MLNQGLAIKKWSATLQGAYRIQNGLLQSFYAFATQRGNDFVRSETVLEWAKLAPSPAQRRNRLLTVRRFAIMMRTEDERYEVPPADAFGREKFTRRIRHIFSSEELKCLFACALQLKPENTIRPITYSTLFALLVATGLRIGEALKLDLNDFTLDGLIVRATKFRKDRLVPLHETTHQAVLSYLKIRHKYGGVEPRIIYL